MLRELQLRFQYLSLVHFIALNLIWLGYLLTCKTSQFIWLTRYTIKLLLYCFRYKSKVSHTKVLIIIFHITQLIYSNIIIVFLLNCFSIAVYHLHEYLSEYLKSILKCFKLQFKSQFQNPTQHQAAFPKQVY